MIRKLIIKLLRFKINLMSKYFVAHKINYYGISRMDFDNGIEILAISPRHALFRYFQRYKRKYKELPRDYSSMIFETTSKFASYLIISSKGEKKYFA